MGRMIISAVVLNKNSSNAKKLEQEACVRTYFDVLEKRVDRIDYTYKLFLLYI